MKKNLRAGLNRRRLENLYRERGVSESAAGVVRRWNGREVVSFCSNDYLGLAADPRIAAAATEGIARYGVGSGASQLVNGHTAAHRALEEAIAELTGRARALLFSTGYMANIGAVTALADRSSTLFEDRLNHASMIDAGLLSRAQLKRYPHKDTGFLAAHLRRDKHCLVATDAVFSMDGDIAPLKAIADLCGQREATLIVDDAHGFGVFGAHGGGVCEMLELGAKRVPVLMGTLGKAAGVFGAFIAGDEDLIETLIQKARPYIYTTAPPPALACAAAAGIAIIRDEGWRRERLFERIAQFRQWMEQAGVACLDSPSPIQGVVTGSAAAALELSEALLSEGLQVSAIRPPTVPDGGARLRIGLSCAHTQEHIARLVECLAKHCAAGKRRAASA